MTVRQGVSSAPGFYRQRASVLDLYEPLAGGALRLRSGGTIADVDVDEQNYWACYFVLGLPFDPEAVVPLLLPVSALRKRL